MPLKSRSLISVINSIDLRDGARDWIIRPFRFQARASFGGDPLSPQQPMVCAALRQRRNLASRTGVSGTFSSMKALLMFALTPMNRTLRAAALSTAFVLGIAMVAPVSAAAPMVKTQAPGYFRMMLGAFEVTALSDGTVDLPVDKLLQESAAKTQAALAKVHLKAPLETSVNAFLINTGSRLVLIDAGAGALFGPTLGKLLDNLQAAGYKADQVDDIVITHMHPDHVGGLASEGAPAFPNATVHADKRDADFWLSKAAMDAAPAESKGFFQGAMASLNPYVGAGRLKAFETGGEIVPGIKSSAAHGHTPGHTVYVVESEGQKLALIGDLIHVGSVQLDNPAVTIAFDTDQKQAQAARRTVFAQLAKEGAVVGASHLQFPGLGRLRASGKGYVWTPVNYTTQFK
jgi:glyoxylase-like metal-dependent hydrolase (beta-lactamase superfamily II)